MAEFALVATPFFMMIFGILNFSIALYSYDFVCYAAQQGVRYAVVNGSTSPHPVSAANVKTYVIGLVVGVLTPASVTVNTTWSPDNKPGSTVTVVVGYTFKPLTPIFSTVNIPLTRTAVMVISQ